MRSSCCNSSNHEWYHAVFTEEVAATDAVKVSTIESAIVSAVEAEEVEMYT